MHCLRCFSQRKRRRASKDCLHAAPSLQNKLWSVLVRGRFYPVAITGDLQKAFLQVRIRENDDALRFFWQPDEKSELQTLGFTPALFGLAPSPFLLGGVIEHHLESCGKPWTENVESRQRGSIWILHSLNETAVNTSCEHDLSVDSKQGVG